VIPKIIHYCWFGRGPMPELVLNCLDSWHKYMPEWEYRLWNEENFDIASSPQYVRQAYEAKKFAFVSDYVRLWALEKFGGVYMDVDFEVFKSFEPLLSNFAFAGYEGSKRQPVMMGVCASEPHGKWIQEQLDLYSDRPFILEDRTMDMTPNTSFITDNMENKGFKADGREKDYLDLHIYPVDFFCPILTSGEDLTSNNTYCVHRGLHSWSGNGGWKSRVLAFVGPKWKTRIIKAKRRIIG